ncbi:hypothetical protein, partial [Cupriavidus basilensis]|uniref:hypothetical protein n=1 Tax=Cupriavidus basilensis TaxID=68895 RepID=UPI0020A68CC7
GGFLFVSFLCRSKKSDRQPPQGDVVRLLGPKTNTAANQSQIKQQEPTVLPLPQSNNQQPINQ